MLQHTRTTCDADEAAFTLELGADELRMLDCSLDALLDLSPQVTAQTGQDSTYSQLTFPAVRRNISSSNSSVASSGTDSCWSTGSSAADSCSGSDAEVTFGRGSSKIGWTNDEDKIILAGVQEFGNKWARIADLLPRGRSDDSVRNRWHRLQRKQVSAAKQRHKKHNRMQPGQSALPFAMDLSSLCAVPEPDSPISGKHGDMWTAEEDRIIDQGVRLQGLKWKAIAALLPGRTDSGCRNRWVRIQERELAQSGMFVHGAPEVMAELRKLGLMPGKPARGCSAVAAAQSSLEAHDVTGVQAMAEVQANIDEAAYEVSAIGLLQPVPQ